METTWSPCYGIDSLPTKKHTELSRECSRMHSTNWGLCSHTKHIHTTAHNTLVCWYCDQIAINHIHLWDKIDKCSHTFACLCVWCFCFSFIPQMHRPMCVCVFVCVWMASWILKIINWYFVSSSLIVFFLFCSCSFCFNIIYSGIQLDCQVYAACDYLCSVLYGSIQFHSVLVLFSLFSPRSCILCMCWAFYICWYEKLYSLELSVPSIICMACICLVVVMRPSELFCHLSISMRHLFQVCNHNFLLMIRCFTCMYIRFCITLHRQEKRNNKISDIEM